jgi:hypothetical protein
VPHERLQHDRHRKPGYSDLRWLFAAFMLVIAVRIWVGAQRDAGRDG